MIKINEINESLENIQSFANDVKDQVQDKNIKMAKCFLDDIIETTVYLKDNLK